MAITSEEADLLIGADGYIHARKRCSTRKENCRYSEWWPTIGAVESRQF